MLKVDHNWRFNRSLAHSSSSTPQIGIDHHNPADASIARSLIPLPLLNTSPAGFEHERRVSIALSREPLPLPLLSARPPGRRGRRVGCERLLFKTKYSILRRAKNRSFFAGGRWQAAREAPLSGYAAEPLAFLDSSSLCSLQAGLTYA